MGGFWDNVKSFLGSAPSSPQGQVVARGPSVASDTAVASRPDPAPAAAPSPSVAISPPLPPPHPSLAGVFNAHRYAVGGRVRRCMGPPPVRPVTGGILNDDRHPWRTYRSGVLNAELHSWQPPFPGVINSGRHKWKAYS